MRIGEDPRESLLQCDVDGGARISKEYQHLVKAVETLKALRASEYSESSDIGSLVALSERAEFKIYTRLYNGFARTTATGLLDICELKRHKPTRVINCAGVRGTPNADWCEDHKVETMRSNVLGALNVVDTCYRLGIHVTHIGSACIYTSSEQEHHAPFKETDEPFYAGSWYGRSRLLCEQSIRHYPNLLLLRIRIPIGPDLQKNNHVARILKFEKIVDRTGVR
ncbi:MAG: hypothetical protein Q9222_007127, partial [Ikaeria aurantiellina]